MNLNTEQLEKVLRRVSNQQPSPEKFLKEAQSALSFYDFDLETADFTEQVVLHIVNTKETPNDVVRLLFFQWLSDVDSRNVGGSASWAAETVPCTFERRLKIYECILLSEKGRRVLDHQFPVPHDANRGFKNSGHVDWYDDERRHATRHYAESLEQYLQASGWSQQNIALVRQSAEYVIGNLADPNWASDPHQNRSFAGRGLVVGYVQSGKTTMMNLSIATAIDVGYKLVIVLGGLTDLLRRQTQRRFDKEVAGKKVLDHDPDVHEANGYKFDQDWKSFIEHPSPRPGVSPRNIERLTTLRNDYKRPIGNAFPPAWVNDSTSCRVVVIKKNKQRLMQLIKGIEQGINLEDRKKLSVLILDDESDQATINIVDPRKTDKRKGINEQLIKLLRVLPNAQYVGVTATPAANCFTDPKDANDIYPRHFILPLARPEGYMGILDFHDLDDELHPIPLEQPQPKKDLHIRNVYNQRDADDNEIQLALDAFVVTGALKLYRQSTGAYSLSQRHHTMFYSDSTFIADMNNARDRILGMWFKGGYASIQGLNRLKTIYENDLWANSPDKDSRAHFPKDFNHLTQYISKTVQLIDQPFDGHGPVLVVNGEKESAQIDFQTRDIWKIVIGGMKLSRGYTIEGLTITYFRRKSTNEAALMQMGRWFGYRAGYRDLVRLWISRNEAARPVPVDIYNYFESVCIDEETLRRKFREWYDLRNPDGSRITPIQIRPLISTVDARLKPVAQNQMWNARLVSMSYSGSRENNVFGDKPEQILHNDGLWKSLFSNFDLESVNIGNGNFKFISDIEHDLMVNLLKSIQRPQEASSDASEALFTSFLSSKECKIKKWSVLMPQVQAGNAKGEWNLLDGTALRVVERSWKYDHVKLNVISDSKGRFPAWVLTDNKEKLSKFVSSDMAKIPQVFTNLQSENRAVVLLYPIKPPGHNGLPILGFECIVPVHPARIGWKVFDQKQDSPLVPALKP
jgi:hypothetical protein